MPPKDEFTVGELEVVTTVFRQYETGLREACIDAKDLHKALVVLGLCPMEQEVIDMTNEVARNGLIYFPEFCRVVLRKFREEDEEQFAQIMFKMLVGTDPFPELFRAKKYKINERFLSKTDFKYIMNNLPIPVSEGDIEDMFTLADQDNDGKISYKEFRMMINPPKPPEGPKPTKKDFQLKYQDSPPVLRVETIAAVQSERVTGSVEVMVGYTNSSLSQPLQPDGRFQDGQNGVVSTAPHI